jgi:hypothetical protein
MASLISGEYEGDIMEEAITIMSDTRFQNEFLKLIDNFDSETYIINLGLSFVNSYVSNIDELGDLGDAGEILKILFKPGYLSEDIPYEKALLKEKTESNKPDSDKYKLAHLSVNKILTKRDISNILSALFTLISKVEDNNLESLYSETESLIYNVRSILPYIFFAIVFLAIFLIINFANNKVNTLTYDEFMKALDSEEVTEMTVTTRGSAYTYQIKGKLSDYEENEERFRPVACRDNVVWHEHYCFRCHCNENGSCNGR